MPGQHEWEHPNEHAILAHKPDPIIWTIQISVDVGISAGPEEWRPWLVETGRGMHDPKQIIRSCLYYWTDTITYDMPLWGAFYGRADPA